MSLSLFAKGNMSYEILEKFKVENLKPMDTPNEIGMKLSKKGRAPKVNPTYFESWVGRFHYVTTSKPGAFYDVGLISRYI